MPNRDEIVLDGFSVEFSLIDETGYPNNLNIIEQEIQSCFPGGKVEQDFRTSPKANTVKKAGYIVKILDEQTDKTIGARFEESRKATERLKERLGNQVGEVFVNPIHNPYYQLDDLAVTPTSTALESGILGKKYSLQVENNPQWNKEKINWNQAIATHNVSGKGVTIGHPDTGYTDHKELKDTDTNRIVVALGADFVEEDDTDGPLDGMKKGFLNFVGHGTGTASVIMSGKELTMSGVAPEAKLMPLRVSNSVALITDLQRNNLARAIKKAAEERCEVVSISMAGPSIGSDGLMNATREAVEKGVIVCAAVGQINDRSKMLPHSFSVPAGYPFVIGVASVTPIFEVDKPDVPSSWSLRGPWVNISAPGDGIHRAYWKGQKLGPGRDLVGTSYGTSYAVAQVAGVAALWVEHWSRNNGPLNDVKGADRTRLFKWVLNNCGIAWHDPTYSHEWGVGTLDALKILNLDWNATNRWKDEPLELIPAFQGEFPRLEALSVCLKSLLDLYFANPKCDVPYSVTFEATSKRFAEDVNAQKRQQEAEDRLSKGNLALEVMLLITLSKKFRERILRELLAFVPDQYIGHCSFPSLAHDPFESSHGADLDDAQMSAEMQALLH